MELNFTNGTDLQKAACRTVAHNLLNFPFDAIPLTLNVSFVPDPLASEHNEFAATTATYGSTEADVRIADVAPNWPQPWDGVRFLQETFAHELGHALFAALPEGRRAAVAQMFGAASDDAAEIYDPGLPWEDRIGEGIAETFKDAFLPRRLRRYANRTARRISISEYPAFRELFRAATEEIPPAAGFNHDVLELDQDSLRVEYPLTAAFAHIETSQYWQHYTAGRDLFSREIPAEHTFEFTFTPPALPVVQGAFVRDTAFGWRYRITVNGVVKDKFRGVWIHSRVNRYMQEFFVEVFRPDSLAFDSAGDRVPTTFAAWLEAADSIFVPNEHEPTQPPFTNNYRLFEDAIPLGALPAELKSSVTVQPGDVVTIHARAYGAEFISPGGPDFEEEALAAVGWMEDYGENLPLMPYVEVGTGGGVPIIRPTADVGPEALSLERRRTKRRVVGAHFES